jgi:hypothetical protein
MVQSEIIISLLVLFISQNPYFIESACTTKQTIITANAERSSLCVSKFGSCDTYYTSDCICVGQSMAIPYFSLSWAVQYTLI